MAFVKSDNVKLLLNIVAQNLGRDPSHVDQWIELLRHHEIETVGDLFALQPEDWIRLNLPVRVERELKNLINGFSIILSLLRQ
jgi:hypothetical protein